MRIPEARWKAAREDYVQGKGPMSAIAYAHGLKVQSVERRAAAEKWTKLRREYMDTSVGELIVKPPLPPEIEPHEVPASLDEDSQAELMQAHAIASLMLIQATRQKLAEMLRSRPVFAVAELGAIARTAASLDASSARLLMTQSRKPSAQRSDNPWDNLDFEATIEPSEAVQADP